jgi:hypothetical protein
MGFTTKYIGESKIYENVTSYLIKGEQLKYKASQGKYQKSGFETERQAAIWVDMRLIEAGKEPVNILKRKKLQS